MSMKMSVAVARRPQLDNSLASQGSASRLHRDAQAHCSSLFAGTASIVVRGCNQDLHEKDQINITNLPVCTSASFKDC
jgi:hypothetical protein